MTYPVTITRADAATPAMPWTTGWIEAEGLGDWSVAAANDPINPGGLAADSQLASAVIISLFTDRRAPEGWRPDEPDRRGWWGDAVAPEGRQPEEIGSHLWLLRNEVTSERNAVFARLYAEEALNWMLRDKVSAAIDVTSGIIDGQRGVWLQIVIKGRDGALVYDRRFERLWREITR